MGTQAHCKRGQIDCQWSRGDNSGDISGSRRVSNSHVWRLASPDVSAGPTAIATMSRRYTAPVNYDAHCGTKAWISATPSTPLRVPPGPIRPSKSAFLASFPSPGESSRRCTGGASGRCGSTRGSGRRRSPIAGIDTCCRKASPASASHSTCRRRSATTRTTSLQPAKLVGSGWRSIRLRTWRISSRGFRSIASRHR